MTKINFYESTQHMYLQTKQTIEVPSKMEVRVRYLNKNVEVMEAKSYPIAVISNTESLSNFIPKITEAIIKSAETEVLPGSADEVDFGIRIVGVGELVVKLHLFLGTRSIFIASAKYIAGYIAFGILKSTIKSKTAKELKEILGIPLDDSKYKF